MKNKITYKLPKPPYELEYDYCKDQKVMDCDWIEDPKCPKTCSLALSKLETIIEGEVINEDGN